MGILDSLKKIYEPVEKDEVKRGGVPFLNGEKSNAHEETSRAADKLVKAAWEQPEAHDQLGNQEKDMLYNEAQRGLTNLGLMANGEIKISKNPLETFSILENGKPIFDKIMDNLDPTRGLEVQNKLYALIDVLLPAAMLQLYNNLDSGASKDTERMDHLLAQAERFDIKKVQGYQTLGDFRSDALVAIRKVGRDSSHNQLA